MPAAAPHGPDEETTLGALTAADVAAAVSDVSDGARIALRVVVRAPRTELVGRHGRALKLKVHAPPVDGAANDEVRRHLAAVCGVRACEVVLAKGARSRDKVVVVRGRSAAQVRARLARDERP